jgi:heme/copper-type cytochrome/quinol oxidase subunit 4
LYGIRLDEWDPKVDGRCYNTNSVDSPSASHPTIDKVYLGITAGWMLTVIILAVIGNAHHIKIVIILALLQYPLHLYFMITVRTANTDLLEGEDQENDWGFGQTVALVLLGLTVLELRNGLKEYWRFEKKFTEQINKSTRKPDEDKLEAAESHGVLHGRGTSMPDEK